MTNTKAKSANQKVGDIEFILTDNYDMFKNYRQVYPEDGVSNAKAKSISQKAADNYGKSGNDRRKNDNPEVADTITKIDGYQAVGENRRAGKW